MANELKPTPPPAAERDRLAERVLLALLSSGDSDGWDDREDLAVAAFQIADAFLRVRRRGAQVER